MNAQAFRAYRIHTLRLTQPEAAAALGVTESTISRWERGSVPIPAIVPLALFGLYVIQRDSYLAEATTLGVTIGKRRV